MSANGLRTFSFHRNEQADVMENIRPFVGVDTGPSRGRSPLAGLDAEAAARRHLHHAFASSALPSFLAPEMDGHPSEFRSLGAERVPLTGTQVVKFRQVLRTIPIYGSLVTVELEDDNELLAINSALGEPPAELDPVATLSPAQALARVRQYAGLGETEPLQAVPCLCYYFDERQQAWFLAYITSDVPRSAPAGAQSRLPGRMDFVVDAHSGQLLAELPRAVSVEGAATEAAEPLWELMLRERQLEEAEDGRGVRRSILARRWGEGWQLVDEALNVHTFDFGFNDLGQASWRLPGEYVHRPPEPWDRGAVSAHANAVEVALFLRRVLRRDNLDNRGGPIVSSINCCYRPRPGSREWHNAAWLGRQMVYGQRVTQQGDLCSYAVALDVVAHEVLHGLTDHTARLEYAGMSGALNESYSDIFGIIVSNLHEPDVARWSWELGEELSDTGIPIRDLSEPGRHRQPEHMRDYRALPITEEADWGGVHINSGIHNKAAYLLLTSRGPDGSFLFDPREVAALFYLCLSQHLSRTSTFSDSRRGVELAARTLFRFHPLKLERLAAMAAAFDAVGISSTLPPGELPGPLAS